MKSSTSIPLGDLGAQQQEIDARHCVGVANGTDSWELALRPACEVIISVVTFIDAAEAVSRIDGSPVRAQERDHVLGHRQASSIGAGIQYPVPIHLSPAYRELTYSRGFSGGGAALSAEFPGGRT